MTVAGRPSSVLPVGDAGVLRSVDDAERRGDVPGFLAPVVRRFVEAAPLETLIRGRIGLRDLLR